MPSAEPIITEQELARTYDGGDHADAWAIVNQYRRARTYHADNPETSIGELVRVSGVTRNHIVSWINEGATPPVVKGLYLAHEHQLLGLTYADITPLNILVAHALTSGTIAARTYRPTFTVETPDQSTVANALELLGFNSQVFEAGSADSSSTIGPKTDAAILGRVLAVLGVPVGSKTDVEDLSLPNYLENAPASVRRRFVDIYLENRAQPTQGGGLRITEDRPQSYRDDLAALIESVAGQSVTTTAKGVTISPAAAQALGFEPADRDEEPADDPLILDETAFARTYGGGAYADPWESVKEYREVMEYASKHPNKGSQAVATATDTPRSRIRTWVDDGGAPDVIRGLETAREYGWLEATYGDPEFTALNTLVANIFSGGSIADATYVPSFTINHRGEDSHIFDALELAGVEYTIVDDREGRADEVRPTTDASVLGRVLAVLGAPVGPKADQRLGLPDYLDRAPASVREQFVYAYLENRATEHEGKATLTVREDRNRDYLKSLAELIDDVAGGGVALRERDIVVSADAVRALGTVR